MLPFAVFSRLRIQNAMKPVSSALLVIRQRARDWYSQSEELKVTLNTVNQSIERSSAASHEISSTVRSTAEASIDLDRTANQLYEVIQRSNTARSETSRLMAEVESSIRGVQDSVSLGLKEISSITETMAQIQEKAKIINEIVFQTKLLSFNASVEAARAGDAGKGFAVVAGEMANLAAVSGAAARDIESILASGISQTNSKIENVTASLNAVTSQAAQAIQVVNSKRMEVAADMRAIGEGVELTREKASQIKVATKEQSQGVGEIDQALQGIQSNTLALGKMADVNYNASVALSELVESAVSSMEKLARHQGLKIEAAVENFDFNSAIQAHIDWKMKLTNYIGKPDGTLDSKVVCKDNNCALGKWIHGAGANYRKSHQLIFDSLKSSHAEFHRTAGEVVELANSGRKKEALILVAPTGRYGTASKKTVGIIEQLRDLVRDGSSSSEAA